MIPNTNKAPIATIIQTQNDIFLPLVGFKQPPQHTRACTLLVVSKFCKQAPLRVEFVAHTCTAVWFCKIFAKQVRHPRDFM